MKPFQNIPIKNIAIVITVAMFFSCKNNTKEVRDFLAEQNLPIGVAKNAYHVYKDSGRISSKLHTPLLYDFSNRKEHPYNEFPNGVRIINFENKGQDSITIVGDYAISYTKTSVSELKGNVVIINHTEQSKLETDQLFWDQTTGYFFSEKQFVLTTLTDTIYGVGFESKEDLSKWVSKNISGEVLTKESL